MDDCSGCGPWPIIGRRLPRHFTFRRDHSAFPAARLEPGCSHGICVSSGHPHNARCGWMEDFQGTAACSGRLYGRLGNGCTGFCGRGRSFVCDGQVAVALRANSYVHRVRLVPDSSGDFHRHSPAALKRLIGTLPSFSTSRIRGVEGDRDAFSSAFEALDAMLQPRWEKQQRAGRRRERNAGARTYPRQFDARSLVHRHSRPARIAKINFPAFHVLRDLDVVRGRKETAWVGVEHVEVARTVDVDPASETELILFLALCRTKVIEESLNMLLHQAVEFSHD